MNMTTRNVLDHHLQAFFEGIDPLMQDFTEASTLMTADATYHGLTEIRNFYQHMLQTLPAGFQPAVKIQHTEVSGDAAFIVWNALPWYPFCTDTFIVQNEKIIYQTFAAHS